VRLPPARPVTGEFQSSLVDTLWAVAGKQAAVEANQAKNAGFQRAKAAKEDEFYTQLPDIEHELKHYKAHFNDKVVYCTCDDPRVSNFLPLLLLQLREARAKGLIATCYKSQQADLFSQNDSEEAIYLEYFGDKNQNMVPDPAEIGIKQLKGDGDFRSAEAVALLKRADIVVTNPPLPLPRVRGADGRPRRATTTS
jgi:Adenine-specific methyltransferase EcoRI